MDKAILDKYLKFVKKWEGGLSRDKADSASAVPCPTVFNGKTGWHTNMGITYAVWKSFYGTDNDKEFLNLEDYPDMWFNIFKKGYWDTVKADQFTNPSIAIFVTGMAWGSGAKQAGLSLQQAILNCGLKINKDGVIGPNTINTANSINPRILFDALAKERERFFRVIGAPGKANNKFLKGWLNRLEDYKKNFRP